MTSAQHEAWEQILSVAKNADLKKVGALASVYLEDGGYAHVVERLGITVETPEAEAPKLVPVPSAPAAPASVEHATVDDHEG